MEIGVGPLQAPPDRPFIEVAADPTLVCAVEAHITAVDPVRWHNGESIRYPYSLVHLAIDHSWKQAVRGDLAVRIFGGVEGDRKYVSVVQPDPNTLNSGMHVLLFVSPPAEIDRGVIASTVEEFYFIDGDRLLRFDRTSAGITVKDARAALDRTEQATARG